MHANTLQALKSELITIVCCSAFGTVAGLLIGIGIRMMRGLS